MHYDLGTHSLDLDGTGRNYSLVSRPQHGLHQFEQHQHDKPHSEGQPEVAGMK